MIDEQVQSLQSVANLLELSDESIRIVDVGSNSVEGSPPYHGLMQAGLCLVIGFEPQAETVTNSQHETHLPFAIGDGREVDFRICAHSGWSSTLKPETGGRRLHPDRSRICTLIRGPACAGRTRS